MIDELIYDMFNDLSASNKVRATTYLLLTSVDQFENSVESLYSKQCNVPSPAIVTKAKSIIEVIRNISASKRKTISALKKHLIYTQMKYKQKPVGVYYDTSKVPNLLHIYGTSAEMIDYYVESVVIGNNVISLPVNMPCPHYIEEKPVYSCRAVIGKLSGHLSLN